VQNARLTDHGGFYPDFKEGPGKPSKDSIPADKPLRWYVKLWKYNLSCNGDPRMTDRPGTWNVQWGKPYARSASSLGERPCELQMARSSGQGCPSPLELTSWHHVLWIPDMGLQDLMFSLLGFLLRSHSLILCSYSSLLQCKCCHCALEVYNFLFHFIGDHSKEYALSLRRDFEFGIWTFAQCGNREDFGDP
jgi:hypothetical protein